MSQQYTQFDPEEARKRRNEHRRLLRQNLTPEEREKMLERRRNYVKQNPSGDANQFDPEEARKLKNERQRLYRQSIPKEEHERRLARRRANRKIKNQNASEEELAKDREKKRNYQRKYKSTLRQKQLEDVRKRRPRRETERPRRRHNLNEPNGEAISEEEKQRRRERKRIYERNRRKKVRERMRNSGQNRNRREKVRELMRNGAQNRLRRLRNRTRDTGRSKCPVCLRDFLTSSLQSHMINHLPRAAKPFQCKLCKKGFSTHNAYRTHHREYHSRELPMTLSTFSCDLCSVTVETRVKYVDHMRQHVAAGDAKIGENEEMLYYQCDAQSCFICFRDKTMFDHHVVTAHPNSIICDTCGKVFAIVENYEKHVTVAHTSDSTEVKELEVTCDYCWQIIKEYEIERHRKQHVMILSEVPTPGFICQDCGKAFLSEAKMMTHMERVHPENHTPDSTTCQVCTTQFKTIKLLHSHYLNVHTYDRPLVCHICSKEFSYLYLLNSHLRGHKGQKRNPKYHDCGYCTKSFNFHVHRNHHQVLAHASIHLANRPFYCPACFRAFQYESLYNDHMRSHEKHRCSICKVYFLGNQILNIHMRAHLRPNGPHKLLGRNKKAKLEERLKEVGTLIETPVVTSGKEMLNLIVKSRKRDFVILGRRGKNNSIEVQDSNSMDLQDNEDKLQDNNAIELQDSNSMDVQDNEDIRSDEADSCNEDIEFLENTPSPEKIITQNDIPMEGQGQGCQDAIPADVIQIFENTKQLMYICDQCPAQFSSTSTFCGHLNYHDDEKNGQFHEIGRSGSSYRRIDLNKIDLRSLRQKYLNSNCKLFECEICKVTILSKINFINHMNGHEASEAVTGSGISEIQQTKQNQQTNQCAENSNAKITEDVSNILKTKEDNPELTKIIIEVTKSQNQNAKSFRKARRLQNDKERQSPSQGDLSHSSMDRLTSLYLRYQMNSVSSQSSLTAQTPDVPDSTATASGGHNATLDEWEDIDEDVPLDYLEDPLEDPLANTAEETFCQRIADSTALSGLRFVPVTYLNRETERDLEFGEIEVKDEPIQEEFLPEVSFFQMEDSEEPGSIEAVRRRASAFESLLSRELIHKVKALPFLTVQLQRLNENVIPGVRVSASSFKIETEPKDDCTTSVPMSSDVDFEDWQDDREPEVTAWSRKSRSKATKRAMCSNRKIKNDRSLSPNSESRAVYSDEDYSPGESDSDTFSPRIRKRRCKEARSGSAKNHRRGSTTQERSISTSKNRSPRTKNMRSGGAKKETSANKKRFGLTKRERSGSTKKEKSGSTKKERSSSAERKRSSSTEKKSSSCAEKEGSSSIEKERSGSAEKERSSSAEKERSSSAEKERSSSAEKERSSSIEKERLSSADTEKERSSSTGKERSSSAGKERSSSTKKERSSSNGKKRSSSTKKERSSSTGKKRSSSTKKERSGSAGKKMSSSTKKERPRRTTKGMPHSTKKDRSRRTTPGRSDSTKKEGEFSCPRCDETFEQKRSLRDHLRLHPNESDEYPCTECDAVYSNSNALLLHTREKHLQHCPICKKRFPASFGLQAHIQRHTSNTYNCSVCSKSYNFLVSLKVHHRKVHGRIPSDISAERPVSEQKDPFHCHVCSKTFDYKKRFDRHLRVHFKAGELAPNGPTFFTRSCDGNGCSMQFIHKETFLRHLETHPPSGIPPSCVSCPKVFAEAETLQSHAQRVHEQNEIDCPYCPNSFKVDAALQEHIESIHKMDLSLSLDGDFICDACGQAFCHQKTLDRHKAMEHGDSVGADGKNIVPYWRKALGGKVSNNEKCSCPVCGKTIGVRGRANHLLSEHTYEHGLSCFICLRQFSRYGRLALHLKEHAQGGLVPPDVILPSKPERIHKKRARKSCRFCGEVFCDQLREFKHYFNYHPTEYLKDNPFYCVHCYRAFPTTADLETHQAKIHDHLKCEECGKQLLSIDSLRTHMQRHNR